MESLDPKGHPSDPGGLLVNTHCTKGWDEVARRKRKCLLRTHFKARFNSNMDYCLSSDTHYVADVSFGTKKLPTGSGACHDSSSY